MMLGRVSFVKIWGESKCEGLNREPALCVQETEGQGDWEGGVKGESDRWWERRWAEFNPVICGRLLHGVWFLFFRQ